MRTFEHPGPVHPERVQCVAANVYPTEIVLTPGTVLLDGVTQAMMAQGARSAVLALQTGSFDPFQFVIPALRGASENQLWYSDTYHAQGAAVIQAGCITYGLRDEQPFLHCHAAWQDASGQTHCGHLVPDACCVHQDVHLRAWLLDGAVFVVVHDAETSFSLFHVTQAPQHVDAVGQHPGTKHRALVLRLRPNQDICLTLEQLCQVHGIQRARICGGVGSLIGGQFTDGNSITPFATETFIRHGEICPGPDGTPQCTIAVTSVDKLGHMHRGTLVRGQNPVLVTFELVLEIQESRA